MRSIFRDTFLHLIKLGEFRSLVHRLGPEAAKSKLAAISRVVDDDLEKPATLAAYHDLLLFILAHPDNRDIHQASTRELRRIATVLQNSEGVRDHLKGTGIAHSEVVAFYGRDVTRWLHDRFGAQLSIDWKDESAGVALDEAMPSLLAPVERDALLAAQPTRRVLRQARGKSDEISWLLDRVERMSDDPVVVDQAWDRLAIPLKWGLKSPRSSITWTRFPPRPLHFFADGMKRPGSLDGEPVPPPVRRLAVETSRPIIDASRAALAVRTRETDPVAVANPRETYLYRLDRGLDVAVIGMLPGRRLPIESYFGFVAARNRIPIAYGGGWVFFDRCEIGINVFDAFRGGESLHALARIIGVYRSLFSPTILTVPPNQIGFGNEEAIASGAYWAYDRLGFRPVEKAVAALADRERGRKTAAASYRSPRSVLLRLAESALHFRLTDDAPGEPLEVDALAQVATRWIAESHSGNLQRAQVAAVRLVTSSLGVSDLERWPARQREAFEQLSLLIAPIRDLRRWPDRDKHRLVKVMRAKGGPVERSFALGLQRQHRLYETWNDLSYGAAIRGSS